MSETHNKQIKALEHKIAMLEMEIKSKENYITYADNLCYDKSKEIDSLTDVLVKMSNNQVTLMKLLQNKIDVNSQVEYRNNFNSISYDLHEANLEIIQLKSKSRSTEKYIDGLKDQLRDETNSKWFYFYQWKEMKKELKKVDGAPWSV